MLARYLLQMIETNGLIIIIFQLDKLLNLQKLKLQYLPKCLVIFYMNYKILTILLIDYIGIIYIVKI